MTRLMLPVVLLLSALACGTSDAPAPEAPSEPAAEPTPAPEVVRAAPIDVSQARPHVVMITLDTFRGDRLGANGYALARTETLDAMANSGVRFSRAYSPLALTIPSHASMFTGKYPPTLGIRSNGSGLLGPEHVTLTEVLAEEGYLTAAATAAFVTTSIWGFEQGFDSYLDDIPAAMDDNFWHGERSADAVIDDALAWKAEQPVGKASFLWVHLYDAHFPFKAPAEYLERTDGRPYDAEIAYVDDQVQRLVDAFEGEPTLFVVVGDHGEGLGDHHELAHSLFTYDATQHVPFFMTGPGLEPTVVTDPVSLVDLMPTVLDVLDLPLPDGVEGRAALSSAPAPVYMETYQLTERFRLAPHLAVVDGVHKLIDVPAPELYDVIADPVEASNLATGNPDEVVRLRGLLQGFGFGPPGEAAELGAEVASQLQALGYVEPLPDVDYGGDLPDPKGHTKMLVDMQNAERKQMIGDMEGALAMLTALSEAYPDVFEFHTRRAMVLRKLDRHDEAREAIDAALALSSEMPQLKLMKAGYMAERGDFAQAEVIFRQVAEAAPYMPRVRTLAMQSVKQQGRIADAIDLGLAYRERHPDDASLAGALAVLLIERGKADLGVPLLEQGLTANPPEVDVAYYAAARATGKGDREGARALLDTELEHYAKNARAAHARMRLCMDLADWACQLTSAELLIAATEQDPLAWHGKVLALFNLGRYDEARAALDEALAFAPDVPDLMLMDANLLAKEGDLEAGKKRYAEATAVLETLKAQADAKQKTNPFGIPEGSLEEAFGVEP